MAANLRDFLRAVILAAAILLAGPDIARAQQADVAEAAATQNEATLTYLNRPIFTFRSNIGTMTPAERAARSYERMIILSDDILVQPIKVQPVTWGDQNGVLLSIGDNLLFGIAPGDVDPEYPLSVAFLAEVAKGKLEEAFAARLEQKKLPVLLRGVGLSVAATLLLAVLTWIVWRLRLRIGAWFHGLISARIEKAAKGHLQWQQSGHPPKGWPGSFSFAHL